ncbi:ATP-binding protein [Paractinoplanes atraurantiacus]|uniref:histidine kinase n=1 Tax=Paractinoplanes atraurantiacus TaxID=1036182 RepID=A0A285GPM7_9ACTN|nr:ATP-binding protein [Actinoplanes atraurantiacus]SNY25174.1 PAS domain S-box-containing protein [Actinoplanes atraurantiacus]
MPAPADVDEQPLPYLDQQATGRRSWPGAGDPATAAGNHSPNAVFDDSVPADATFVLAELAILLIGDTSGAEGASLLLKRRFSVGGVHMRKESRAQQDVRARNNAVGAPALDRLVEVVAVVTEVPIVVAYLITSTTRTVLSCLGTEALAPGDEMPLAGSLAADVVETGLPLIVDDVLADPRLADKAPVRDCGISAYCGFPVRDSDGRVIAVLAVAAHHRRNWATRHLRSLDAATQLFGDLLSGPVTVMATTADVRSPSRTERAESMFMSLLDAAPDAIVGVTADGTITLINAHAEHLFGYRREELLGQPIELLVPERFRDLHPAHRDRYFAHPKRRPMGAGLALTAKRKDGSEFPAEISLSALETDHGVIVSAAIRDVTDRLIAQGERERLIAQAERDAAERRTQHARRLESLGELAGGVAHDFNNILAVISNYSELIQDSLAADEVTRADITAARDDLGQISRAAERAARLTKQLLAFGRRDITQAEVLDLNHIIGEVEQMLRRSLGEHIQLSTQLEPSLRPVFADASQLEQVLVNLAVNARDAMPGGGTLSIDTSNAELDGDDATTTRLPAGTYVRLRVSDTGTGMTPEVMEHAFEPFYTTKPRGSGTGLGLATIYGIVTSAGGDVSLYSEAGIGTSVTILLPTAEAGAGNVADIPASPGQAGADPHGTILLVEDEDALRQVAHRILTRAGYTVLPAASGEQAIHIAQTHPERIDLLLSDVIMPKMLGNEVAERMQTVRPGTPVLFMSGYAQPVLNENGTLRDGILIIEKPFTSHELLDRIRAVLHDQAAVQ